MFCIMEFMHRLLLLWLFKRVEYERRGTLLNTPLLEKTPLVVVPNSPPVCRRCNGSTCSPLIYLSNKPNPALPPSFPTFWCAPTMGVVAVGVVIFLLRVCLLSLSTRIPLPRPSIRVIFALVIDDMVHAFANRNSLAAQKQTGRVHFFLPTFLMLHLGSWQGALIARFAL